MEALPYKSLYRAMLPEPTLRGVKSLTGFSDFASKFLNFVTKAYLATNPIDLMKPKKSLGQYLLRCRWVISTLIKAAEIGPEDVVLEVGSGTGALTRALAKHAKEVIAVEKDERLAEELKNSLKNEGIKNVEIITGDVLRVLGLTLGVLETKLTTTTTKRYKMVSNIPYYLTSRLIRVLLENEPRPKSIVLTIQKEVAQRIVAKPPKMNLLALSIQVFGTPKIIKTVPASCFSPKPKIESAIIKISDISDTLFRVNTIDPKVFFRIAGAAFSQKRKIITNTLTKLGLEKTDIERALTQGGTNPHTDDINMDVKKTRPEELSKEAWVRLVKMLELILEKQVSWQAQSPLSLISKSPLPRSLPNQEHID